MADNGPGSDQDEAADVECLRVLCSVLCRVYSLQPIAKVVHECVTSCEKNILKIYMYIHIVPKFSTRVN